jgi:hypothetical protein
MKVWLFRKTGWKILRPTRAPWGEATDLWTDGDWRWFRRFNAPMGFLCVPPHMVQLDPTQQHADHQRREG